MGLLVSLRSIIFPLQQPHVSEYMTVSILFCTKKTAIANGSDSWVEAYNSARAFVANLSTAELVNICTVSTDGTGSGFKGYAPSFSDGPASLISTPGASAFAVGTTVASTWDRNLFYQRFAQQGKEAQRRGVNEGTIPVSAPMGRNPLGGRNAESFGPDPYLNGAAFEAAVRGLQENNVIAIGKHYILYEQGLAAICCQAKNLTD